ncbi:MAG: 50S ribosomal protein L18 [Clostridia bacterium]|nr:50S ribosomal protein L18 [Clostridia bacterium]
MITKKNKNEARKVRHVRLRNNLAGTATRPRLNVYKSLKHIYAQIIDDSNDKTLVSCNTTQKQYADTLKSMTNKEQAAFIGKTLGELAIKAGIKEVVFDRGGYLYTGRVKELAEGARSAGLEF